MRSQLARGGATLLIAVVVVLALIYGQFFEPFIRVEVAVAVGFAQLHPLVKITAVLLAAVAFLTLGSFLVSWVEEGD